MLRGDWRSVIRKVEDLKYAVYSFREWNSDVLSLDSVNEDFHLVTEGENKYILL